MILKDQDFQHQACIIMKNHMTVEMEGGGVKGSGGRWRGVRGNLPPKLRLAPLLLLLPHPLLLAPLLLPLPLLCDPLLLPLFLFLDLGAYP